MLHFKNAMQSEHFEMQVLCESSCQVNFWVIGGFNLHEMGSNALCKKFPARGEELDTEDMRRHLNCAVLPGFLDSLLEHNLFRKEWLCYCLACGPPSIMQCLMHLSLSRQAVRNKNDSAAIRCLLHNI